MRHSHRQPQYKVGYTLTGIQVICNRSSKAGLFDIGRIQKRIQQYLSLMPQRGAIIIILESRISEVGEFLRNHQVQSSVPWVLK